MDTLNATWGAGHVALDRSAPLAPAFGFDGTYLRIGPSPAEAMYAQHLNTSIGRTFSQGAELRFAQDTRRLASINVGLPYPLTVVESLGELLALPSVMGALRWVEGEAPDPTAEHATLAPEHWLWHLTAARPTRRWRIGRDLDLLLDADMKVCGLLLSDPIGRLPGAPRAPALRRLALDAYALHFKYEWAEAPWTPRDVAQAAATIGQLQRLPGAAPLDRFGIALIPAA